MTGLISVIMPAYRAALTVREAIDSVLAQTDPNWELIVINDCSPDDTAEIVKTYLSDPRIRLLENAENSGVSLTRKKGVDAAAGDWIAFLDSDDKWAPEKLEKQRALQEQSGAELLFTGSTFMDENGKPIDWYLHAPAEISYRKLLDQNVISNSSVLVKKSIYLEHAAMNDSIHEDFACWLGALRAGCRARGIDEPLLIYRLSASSRSGNKIKAAKMNWKTYRWCGLSVPAAAYHMIGYTVNGLLKYRSIRKASEEKAP